MKNILLPIVLILISIISYGQYCPYLGPNQALPCGVNSTTLTADLSQCGPGGPNPNQTTNYGVTNITYSPQTNTGNQLFMSDDSQQGPFNIGFNFCFFGTTYTQFYVGSNGWISFSGGQPTTFTSSPIPTGNALVPKNCIMGPWQDWHPGLGGQIRYQTSGVAPCRKLTVSWIGVPMFSCTGNQGTFHIVIYESTNIIENYIQNKPACVNWQGGTAVEGIHNLAGTVGIVVPGRNSTAWVANNDAWRWTPSGPTVTPVLTWYQVGNPNPIGTGPTITVTPPPAGANYTCQFVYPICNAGWSTCNANAGLGPDTVFVIPGPPNIQTAISSFTEPLCYLDCDGTATVNPITGGPTYTYLWSNGQTTQTAVNLCAGVYNVLVTDNNGCTGNSSVTINQPTQVIFDSLVGVDVTCNLNDGQIYIYGNDGTPTYDYFIDGVQSNNDTILNLSGGNYLITLQDINGCSIDSTIYIDSPTVILPSLITDFTRLCIPGEFTFTNTSTPIANVVSSYITFGDGFDTTVLSNVVSHTYPNVGQWNVSLTVTSDYGCQYTQTYTNFIETSPLPTAQFNVTPNPTTMFETTVVVQDFSINNIVNWNWVAPGSSQGVSSLENPTLNYPDGETGEYMIYLTVTDDLGCTDTTSVKLIVLSDVLSYIPNAFTPDGDEHNQIWKYSFAGIETSGFSMYIYNRWGEMIWESHDVSGYWDGSYNGKIVPDGVYMWRADFDVLNDAERRVLNGSITVLR
jgi:gliding motility-associated-like protein